MNNKTIFYVINEEGIREEAQILAKYKLSNMQDYITYTYGEINDNDMIKIYSTGVEFDGTNYSYREISTNEEWNEVKEIMKSIARDPNEPIAESYVSNLKLSGEEVSIRKPKKLLVSRKFADTLADKYSETEDSPMINALKDVNVETALNTPAEFILNQDSSVEKEEPLHQTIEIPTFEELQARNKNIENVIASAKVEPKTEEPVSLEEMVELNNKPEEPSINVEKSQKGNYKEKFKEEVEPLLMNVYEKQMKQIEELEEELSKTKFDLFEKQKEALSLKKEKEELEDQSNALKEELDGVQQKMNGIMNVIQGNTNNND